MYKESIFITGGGNLLRSNSFGEHYFMSPKEEFVRQVSDNEFDYLSSACIKAEIETNGEFDKMPTWHFITRVLVEENDSDYRWETSNNGGNYSFRTYHDWYVAQYPDGSWKFAFVEVFSTSAEFSYDQLAASFQSDLGTLYLSNTEGSVSYQSQAGIEWVETGESFTSSRGVVQKEQEKVYNSSEVLEKVAEMSTFEHLWNEVYQFIPSRWDDDEKETTEWNALSFSDKKLVITRLKELGCIRIFQQMGGRRGRENRSCNRSHSRR